jgi:hypothetical protein
MTSTACMPSMESPRTEKSTTTATALRVLADAFGVGTILWEVNALNENNVNGTTMEFYRTDVMLFFRDNRLLHSPL